MRTCYKQTYPFRLATTSFIYPLDYVENVRRLAPWVDEIELLLLERDNLPDFEQINQLQAIAAPLDITYNVHLPLDLELGAVDNHQRHRSVSALVRALRHVKPLGATSNTLHLVIDDRVKGASDVPAWQSRCIESLEQVLKLTTVQPRQISVETLDFSPLWLVDIVEALDLSICIDVGHLIRYDHNLATTLSLFQDRISMYHLHGVANGKDHLSLTHLGTDAGTILAPVLKHFYGSVSLEVFQHRHFVESLESLAVLMSPTTTNRSKDSRVG